LKYFIEMVRPRRMYQLGPIGEIDFQLQKLTMYEVASDKAYDCYVESSENGHITFEQVDWAFETGELVYVDENSVVVCGIEMSDQELLKRRLTGGVGKEIFK